MDLFAACADGAGTPQPAADSRDLPGPAAPRGISFLKVLAPLDQPQMPDVMTAPTRLPSAVSHPTIADIETPSADLLLALTRAS
jgi:hypothetical protein